MGPILDEVVGAIDVDNGVQVDLADALAIADEDGIGREQCAMVLAIVYWETPTSPRFLNTSLIMTESSSEISRSS